MLIEPPQDQHCGGFVYDPALPGGLNASLPKQALGLLACEGLVDLVDRQFRLPAQGADKAQDIAGLRGFLAARTQRDANDYGIGLSLACRIKDGTDIGGQPGAVDDAGGQRGGYVVDAGGHADAAIANVKGEKPHEK